ncbi:MAG TPA: Insertion element protein [Pseudonocardiaceae bacterium]
MTTGERAGERAVVLCCPYCAEEDLRPQETPHGAWLCLSCRRVFAVKFVGLVPQEVGR